MKRGVAVVSLAGAAVLGWPSTRVCADSEGTTARLAWVRVPGAESCASVADLQRDVSARLGRDAFAEPAARTIEGTARRQGQRWTADLYIRALDGTLLGSRELTSEASDCMALSGAVALAIALAIDPDAALAPPAPSAAAGSSSRPPRPPRSPGPPNPRVRSAEAWPGGHPHWSWSCLSTTPRRGLPSPHA